MMRVQLYCPKLDLFSVRESRVRSSMCHALIEIRVEFRYTHYAVKFVN